jgi:isopentenyl-diphosphate delta-isomerase
MGLEAPLTRITEFTYRAEVGTGLIEHEYDHLFVGRCDAVPHPDPSEVADWGWQSPAALEQAIRRRPSRFTAWLPFALSAWRRASRTASRTELVRRCS